MIRDIYQDMLDRSRLEPDIAQANIIDAMQTLYDELGDRQQRSNSLLGRLVDGLFGKEPAPKGLYIWGDVGRGKTVLMNLLHEALPFDAKARKHFHHFMLDVHAELAALQGSEGKLKNPLQTLARQYAERYRVLCLDEFIVTNITDAMLLYGLLDALLDNGVVLIATSNRIPDDLYLNGLQRERFLPAIELIKQRMQVLHLDSDTDHRRELLEHSNLYHCPIDETTDEVLMREFESFASGDVEHHRHILVHKRDIPFIARSEEIIWFDFDVLCDAPRATPDYIQIASDFRIVILSNVPAMDESVDDKARRFIYLIDELYDRRVTLIMSAAVPVEELYSGDMLAFAFRRTMSRLIEMRSHSYLTESSQRET